MRLTNLLTNLIIDGGHGDLIKLISNNLTGIFYLSLYTRVFYYIVFSSKIRVLRYKLVLKFYSIFFYISLVYRENSRSSNYLLLEISFQQPNETFEGISAAPPSPQMTVTK